MSGEALGKVQSLAQFCHEHDLTTTADVDSHIHSGLRSMPTTKTYARWNARALAELQAKRDHARNLYYEAIASGEVVEPPKPTLEEVANGLPELVSTQAAKRLLEKRRIAALAKANGEGE